MPSWPLRQGEEAVLDENSARDDSEASHPADAGDVPQGASEPEESRQQSSVGVSLSGPVEQEPEIKSESSSEDESSNLEPELPLRMVCSWYILR